MEKELLWKVGGYVLTLVVYFLLSWRYKGREEVSKEILNQELVFKEKIKAGQLKKKAVQEFVALLPKYLQIFVNESTIEALVNELQPLFQKMKEGK